MTGTTSSLAALLLLPLLGGCAVGYNTTLFMTKSNIGIDADTKPPTLELSIARREGVIAPSFEGGQTPPVMASFRARSNPFARFFLGVQSTFAGGDAAVALSKGPGGASATHESALCLSQKPARRTFMGVDVSIPEPGTVEPFFFATDTTLGLKVAWSGTTGQFPDTIRLGFNRKEFAWAPVFGTGTVQCKVPGTTIDGTYAVWVPPFVAVLDNDVQSGGPSDTGVRWLQYFATGAAATTLANQDEVRRVMMDRMDPAVAHAEWGSGAACIDDWLGQDPARVKELTDWWAGQGLSGLGVFLIKDDRFKKERDAFIRSKGITCP